MSRVAKKNITISQEIQVELCNNIIYIQGKYGKLMHNIHKNVKVIYQNYTLSFYPTQIKKNNSWALVGTTRSIINNMVIGVNIGFFKKMYLVGVGYRAIIEDNILHLHLGFSHSIKYNIPDNITIKCPSPTEILLHSSDKQLIGQVSANIRNFRPPEPYKGKGIRYSDEIIILKEAKKK